MSQRQEVTSLETCQDGSSQQETPGSECLRSNQSMGCPIKFSDVDSLDPRSECLRSNQSMGCPIKFSDVQHSLDPRLQEREAEPPEPGPCRVSMKSHQSMFCPLEFENVNQSADWRDMQQRSEVPSVQQQKEHLDSIFLLLEENISDFMKRQLKKYQEMLNLGSQPCSDVWEEEGSDEEQSSSAGEAFLEILQIFLRRMEQVELAECLQSGQPAPVYQRKLKSSLKRRFQCVFEGIVKAGNPMLLNQIYTELFVTEGGSGAINQEHEVRRIEAAFRKHTRPEPTIRCEEIFQPMPALGRPIRTVMTTGVAGIGKTVLTQKFTLDWAEGKANQDIHFMFPLTFRELNKLGGEMLSLLELIHIFFPEIKGAGIHKFDHNGVVFILDGLDECRLPLDFQNNQVLTEASERASADVLLTNLIKGKLLPSARLWITTRPAAASLVPPECVDLLTDVRGFSNTHKKEYFAKRFRDKDLARRVIGHIKTSRSLYIMCHIPIFCWITATVLEQTREGEQLPRTLTEMYIHFLVVQSQLKAVKYDEEDDTETPWSLENRRMIRSLGKLAFEQLQKGNLIFYKSDLTDCGVDVTAASVYSGIFTQVGESRGIHPDMLFCFVHLSVQEFLAALHVYQTFVDSGVSLMEDQPAFQSLETGSREPLEDHFYQRAVDRALQSSSGHLDLFLRFLLGLSAPTNQALLRGLLTRTGISSQANQNAAEYIKKKIGEDLSPERSINLFHCLTELKDRTLVEQIQQYLRSGSLSTDQLSPAQWSALVFILLSSEKDLEVFDLKKFSASENAFLKLLPVVAASSKVLLSGCNLSAESCQALSSILSSPSSSLVELDVSNNDLHDSGVALLSAGLASPHCHLETLRLSGCLITEEGCKSLISALRSNPSHLRELDLSYNNPGESGEKLLSVELENPSWRLDVLRLEPAGAQWLRPALRKYSCRLVVDMETVNTNIRLSDDRRTMWHVEEEEPYPDGPRRFHWCQLLCSDGLTGRGYWEVEWSGGGFVSVSYDDVSRKGDGDDCLFGQNSRSWSLDCSNVGYYACHDKMVTTIQSLSSFTGGASNRVAVYVDCPAGTLSFYRVMGDDTLTHLHTFSITFTGPVYPGFRLWAGCSLRLCSLQKGVASKGTRPL